MMELDDLHSIHFAELDFKYIVGSGLQHVVSRLTTHDSQRPLGCLAHPHMTERAENMLVLAHISVVLLESLVLATSWARHVTEST